MIRRLVVIGALLGLLFTLGCGNKGPLYLPEDAAADTSEENDEQRKR